VMYSISKSLSSLLAILVKLISNLKFLSSHLRLPSGLPFATATPLQVSNPKPNCPKGLYVTWTSKNSNVWLCCKNSDFRGYCKKADQAPFPYRPRRKFVCCQYPSGKVLNKEKNGCTIPSPTYQPTPSPTPSSTDQPTPSPSAVPEPTPSGPLLRINRHHLLRINQHHRLHHRLQINQHHRQVQYPNLRHLDQHHLLRINQHHLLRINQQQHLNQQLLNIATQATI
jgi:hypothetical protein